MDKIDIRDLRVGDWVMVYPWDETPWEPQKITDIIFHSWEGSDFCDTVGVEGGDELSLDDIKPILLTKEILAKSGFTARSGYWEYRDNYCRVKVDIAPKIEIEGEIFGEPPILLQVDGATFNLSIIIEYVHELQHALRLCGVEKEIII